MLANGYSSQPSIDAVEKKKSISEHPNPPQDAFSILRNTRKWEIMTVLCWCLASPQSKGGGRENRGVKVRRGKQISLFLGTLQLQNFVLTKLVLLPTSCGLFSCCF